MATGIQPFLPIPVGAISGATWFLYTLVGCLLLAIRLPLFLAINVSYFLTVNILSLLMPLAPRAISRILRGIDWFHCHVILFCLGFMRPSLHLYTLKDSTGERGSVAVVPAKSSWTASTSDAIQPGDLVICNHQSHIDVIFLTAKFSPIFTAVSAKEPHKITIIPRIKALFSSGGATPNPGGVPLTAEILDGALHPIVVFAEGTTTNGRGILKFVADLSILAQRPNQRIHLVGIKYGLSQAMGFSPTYPINSFSKLLGHLLRCAMQPINTIQARWISANSFYAWNAFDLKDPQKSMTQLAEVESQMLHLRTLSISLKEKVAFLAAYNTRFK